MKLNESSTSPPPNSVSSDNKMRPIRTLNLNECIKDCIVIFENGPGAYPLQKASVSLTPEAVTRRSIEFPSVLNNSDAV